MNLAVFRCCSDVAYGETYKLCGAASCGSIGNCCRGQSVKAYLKTKASCLFHSQELASVLCGNNLCKVCIRYGINCCHTLRNLLCGDKRAVCCGQSITQRVIASHCQASFTGTRSVDGKVHSVIPVCFRILRLGLRNDGLLIIVICRLNGRSVSVGICLCRVCRNGLTLVISLELSSVGKHNIYLESYGPFCFYSEVSALIRHIYQIAALLYTVADAGLSGCCQFIVGDLILKLISFADFHFFRKYQLDHRRINQRVLIVAFADRLILSRSFCGAFALSGSFCPGFRLCFCLNRSFRLCFCLSRCLGPGFVLCRSFGHGLSRSLSLCFGIGFCFRRSFRLGLSYRFGDCFGRGLSLRFRICLVFLRFNRQIHFRKSVLRIRFRSDIFIGIRKL